MGTIGGARPQKTWRGKCGAGRQRPAAGEAGLSWWASPQVGRQNPPFHTGKPLLGHGMYRYKVERVYDIVIRTSAGLGPPGRPLTTFPVPITYFFVKMSALVDPLA